MKSTGIVRDIDQVGRVVIPKETRRSLGINEKDPLEIFVEDDKIILRKYEPACLFCGHEGEMVTYNNRRICRDCVDKIKEL